MHLTPEVSSGFVTPKRNYQLFLPYSLEKEGSEVLDELNVFGDSDSNPDSTTKDSSSFDEKQVVQDKDHFVEEDL